MKTNDEPIIVEQIFDNSIEEVWTAITGLDQMKQWFFDNIESFKPEIGFETQFDVYSGERLFRHLWKITEVVPMKKIKYNWKYEGFEGDSFVIFELFEENKQVRLNLSCEVVEDFPSNIPEFERASCIGGWNYFIKERLMAFLSNA